MQEYYILENQQCEENVYNPDTQCYSQRVYDFKKAKKIKANDERGAIKKFILNTYGEFRAEDSYKLLVKFEDDIIKKYYVAVECPPRFVFLEYEDSLEW